VKFFRINIYLKIKYYFLSFFTNEKNLDTIVAKILFKNSNKKYFFFTSQLRVGFIILLKYLKYKNPQKNEIIFLSYNLAEMVNVAKNLKFKIKFCDLDYKNGFYKVENIKKIINKKTSSIVLTNMFNSYEETLELKKFCKRKKIILIEDNAICFDNFKKINGKKFYTGMFGDYALYSFNIMKNISALYGGGVTTNDKNFKNFANVELSNYSNFPHTLIIKQSIIFFILKSLSNNFLYKLLFFNLVKYAHFKNNLFLLKIFYPSLKFRNTSFPKYYKTKVSSITKKLVYFQLLDLKNRSQNHKERKKKNIYYHQKLINKKNKNIQLLPIKDFNFQNFIDYPILVKNKKKLNKYLLKKGIETRIIYYRNCSKVFNIDKAKTKNSEMYENEILCLPNHKKITRKYIDYIIEEISSF
jgi:dTDP-4-amino-4,6-dideoxygalactose transaminase